MSVTQFRGIKKHRGDYGRLAESSFLGRDLRLAMHASGDRQTALDLIWSVVTSPEEQQVVYAELEAEANALLSVPVISEAVNSAAELLFRERRVTGVIRELTPKAHN